MELVERDLFKEPLSGDELRALIGDRPVGDFLSLRSPSFRKLGLDPADLTDEQMLSMMLGEPRLIRRPLVVAGDRVIVGNDPAAFADAFS